MFGKKKAPEIQGNLDKELLLSQIEKIKNGDYTPADTSAYSDPALAERFNEMIDVLQKSNNNYVMRLNESMNIVGDNSFVKQMYDQIDAQTKSIQEIKGSEENLLSSIGGVHSAITNITKGTSEMKSALSDSVSNINENIQMVSTSSNAILALNEQLQNFHERIEKIVEIVDIVKSVADESNLLALNASIEAARAGEAGKGFAVVADQVRQLSTNTSESAEDIVRYVAQLREGINELAATMNETTERLVLGNKQVEESLNDIRGINGQMQKLENEVSQISENIDLQKTTMDDFSVVLGDVLDGYNTLASVCIDTGIHSFNINRAIDTARSDLYRGFSNVTELDKLDIFRTDHFIQLWRVYNNAVGFESLRHEQTNNQDRCKLGLWLKSMSDPVIRDSRQFKELYDAHDKFHKLSEASWLAKDKNDKAAALEEFASLQKQFEVFDSKISALKSFMSAHGYSEVTETVVFGK
ncbi:MAG: methyl-accepting chemotaxis protein [Agathobacter sp.]